MIVAPQPEAVEAGAIVLKNGGNAVDAAITCAMVQNVVDPQMCGIAGFGSMHLYVPSKNFHGFIDFHTTAPGKVRDDMWEDLIEGEALDGFGFFLKGQVNEVGYQSIMTPGSLKAYFEAVTPRFTANSNTIDVSNRIPCFITSDLERLGYPIARSCHSYAFAGVHGIRIKDGRLDGGADPSHDGMALEI